MRAANVLVLAIAASLSVNAIAASDQKPLSVIDQGARTSFLGFSILPPDGQGWHVQEQGFNWVTHTKSPTGARTHTVLLMASSEAVDLKPGESRDFLGYVNRAAAARAENSRHQNALRRISPATIDRAECARVDFSAEDRGVPWAPGDVYQLQGFDIFCLHPRSQQMLVVLGYSQRFEKGRAPVALDREVTSFVDSLRFSPEIARRFSLGPLVGRFSYDRSVFFPNGRNEIRETYLLSALKEGGYKEGVVLSPSRESVQKLAIEYDARWLMSVEEGVRPELGCVLGKVERWSEALEAFQAASRNRPDSVQIMGYLGVAAHVAGRYEESVQYFKKAVALESGYFENKPQQKSIFRASERGISVLDR